MNVIAATRGYVDRIVSDPSTPGMKVLLLDDATTKTVATVYSQTQILERDVFLVERLEQTSRHEPMRHLKAAVFVRPTWANCDLLKRELQDPKFSEYHLYFANVVPPEMLDALADADEHESVRQVQEVFADYVAVNEDLFTVNQRQSLRLSVGDGARDAARAELADTKSARDAALRDADRAVASSAARDAMLDDKLREAAATAEALHEATLKERDATIVRAETALSQVTASARAAESRSRELETALQAANARAAELVAEAAAAAARDVPKDDDAASVMTTELERRVAELEAELETAATRQAHADEALRSAQSDCDAARAERDATDRDRLRLEAALADEKTKASAAAAEAAAAAVSEQRNGETTPGGDSLRAERDAAVERAEAAEAKLTQRSSRLSELRASLDDRRKEAGTDAALMASKRLRDAEQQAEALGGELVAAKLEIAQLSAELDEARHRLAKRSGETASQPGTPTTTKQSSGGSFFGRRRAPAATR
mmetsp:Transcript_27427/g.109853  ORF Transcript_27427/g.109853 Transcript_27427/m.109853 type:complete len:491 (+) Transcript_27427:294-1766(+)